LAFWREGSVYFDFCGTPTQTRAHWTNNLDNELEIVVCKPLVKIVCFFMPSVLHLQLYCSIC
jgi:hypothetical protein